VLIDDGSTPPEDRSLTRPAFWAAYLARMWGMDDSDSRLVAEWFETDRTAADAAWDAHLWQVADIRVPLDGGHTLWVTSRELPTDWGTDYEITHPGWGRTTRLATIDRYVALRLGTAEHSAGPGLSWRELTHIATTTDQSAPGVHDPRTRLLLLLPALGDEDVPADAADLIGRALASVGVPAVEAVRAARSLLERPIWPAAHWTAPGGEPESGLPKRWWQRLRAAGARSEHPPTGILRCDAPSSPRSTAALTQGLGHEQIERLARALGTWDS